MEVIAWGKLCNNFNFILKMLMFPFLATLQFSARSHCRIPLKYLIVYIDNFSYRCLNIVSCDKVKALCYYRIHAQKRFCLIPMFAGDLDLVRLIKRKSLSRGDGDMNNFKRDARSGFIFVALLITMIFLGSCSGVKYIYDPGTNFSGLNSYAWTTTSSLSRQESLTVTNIKFFADQILQQKGYKKTSEKPDLLISIDNEYEVNTISNNSYQLQMLSLNIYRTESNQLIWRGTAPGYINTDAASSDLKNAVWDVLAKFPPK